MITNFMNRTSAPKHVHKSRQVMMMCINGWFLIMDSVNANLRGLFRDYKESAFYLN